MAIFAELHPGADLGGVNFLKDLFVTEAHRGQGIGEELMRFLAQEARRHGVDRIDLTTEDWNTGAIGFYQRLGGAPQAQKVFFRFSGEAFERLAGEDVA
jgi:ribosomal protein S18 acetylase RimI-like enzyme